MRGVNDSIDTVNAAAAAIATAERRVQQVTSQRRRWGGCLSCYWCFGDMRHIRRIGHASFIPETTLPWPAHVVPEITTHTSAFVLPFIAPPSSPTSTLRSESLSATPTPGSLFSLTALSAEACCSVGPASMFAIGPYAHEIQLVSPPVFSAFTTEPSTAALTPPEPVHLTTPSSPEVPFSQLLLSSLDSNLRKGYGRRSHSYQHYSGSPVGHFISSSSGCSGTSTPFLDFESHSSSSVASHNVTHQISSLNSMQVDDRTRAVGYVEDSRDNYQHCAPIIDLRVSVELTTEEVAQSVKSQKLKSCTRLETKCIQIN